MDEKRFAVKPAILSIIIVGLMLLLSGAAVGAEGNYEKENAPEDPTGPHTSGESCQEKAERTYMFGVFSEELPVIEGRFVSFSYEDGILYNYTLIYENEEIVFKSIMIEGFTAEEFPKMDGAVFRMNGTTCDLWAHNNPTGMLQITAQKSDTPVIIKAELAEGLGLTKLTNGTYEITGMNEQAYLKLGGAELSINGQQLNADIGSYGHFMFSSVPGKGYGSSEYRYQYTMAIMNGGIDSELHVLSSNGDSLTQKFEYKGKVEMKLKSMDKNRLRITVESNEHKGKVVGINVDKETLKVQKCEEITVKLDGDALKEAKGMDEVLKAEGSEGKYWIEEGPEGFQAMVYVPSFSEHEITLEKSADRTEPAMLILGNLAAVIIALIIVGIMVFILVRVKGQN
jgi:hypothetical protein